MAKPQVGQPVQFYPSARGIPQAGVIVHVVTPDSVNLAIWDRDGKPDTRLDVEHIGTGEERPVGPHCSPLESGEAAPK